MKKKNDQARLQTKIKELSRLVAIGDAALTDFELLGITDQRELADADPKELYERLCEMKGVRLHDGYQTLIATAVRQARTKPKKKTTKKATKAARTRPAL